MEINPSNLYVKKRVFDIKFTTNKLSGKKKLKIFFDEYKFLLEFFINDKSLTSKFEKLAIKTNNYDWINYFVLIDEFHKEDYDKKKLIEEIKKIRNNTLDYLLIRLINKKIN